MVIPKVVAVVTSLDEANEGIALGADVLEVRVDLSEDEPQLLLESIDRLGKPLILTIRPTWEGGAYEGSDGDRVLLFKKLMPMADYIDVELRAKNIDELASLTEGSGVSSIVSYHEFVETPPEKVMFDILAQCQEKGDIGKLAVMPTDPGDVLALFEATLKAPKPVCAIAMGDIGMHSRIVAPIYGSMLTYGFVRKSVAPGQMRVDKIIEGLKLLGLR